jgi:rhodanese-related sulfurtransferase/DNA-binding transcriptional ArsR family regulator
MDRPKDSIAFRNAIYEQFARIGKAVSSPRRLELLDLLSQGPRTVESLAKGLTQSVANTSQHLQILRSARLVEAEKDGLYVNYRLADDAVSEFFIALRKLAEFRLAELQQVTRQFLNKHGMLEEVDREKLIAKVQNGEVMVVDLRSTAEYERHHLPGAVSIPISQLEKHLDELPRDQDIVAYCRGPYCVIGIEAVELMRDHGLDAHRLLEGVPEWKALGYELEPTKQD